MAQPPTYEVIDLGTVGANGQPFAIAKNGLVAGAAQIGDIVRAGPRYNPDLKDIVAFSAHAWGQAVGEAQTDSPDLVVRSRQLARSVRIRSRM